MRKNLYLFVLIAILVLTACNKEVNQSSKTPVTSQEKLPEHVYHLKSGVDFDLQNKGTAFDGQNIAYTWYLYKFDENLENLEKSEWMLLGENLKNVNMKITPQGGYYKIGMCVIDDIGASSCSIEELNGILQKNNFFSLYSKIPEMKEKMAKLIPLDKNKVGIPVK